MFMQNKRILIVGASNDLAVDLNRQLLARGAKLGLHYNRNKKSLAEYRDSSLVKKFKKNLQSAVSCRELVDDFVAWAGGIDCLVQLSGDINRAIHWDKLTEKDWKFDLDMNLVMPFFLAKRAIYHMKPHGGRIVLISTASASHGGGRSSLAYGVAKNGIECLAKALARDCAKDKILVNAVAPGFIQSKFHTKKMKMTKQQLAKRADLIPLKRSGTKREFAGAVSFLLSDESSFITGETITVSGGDWL